MVYFPKTVCAVHTKGRFTMMKRSKLSCSKMIKATAILLACIALVAGFYLLIDGVSDYIKYSDFQGYAYKAEAGMQNAVIGLTCVLSGWVGGLSLYGFGTIVKAHETTRIADQNNA